MKSLITYTLLAALLPFTANADGPGGWGGPGGFAAWGADFPSCAVSVHPSLLKVEASN